MDTDPIADVLERTDAVGWHPRVYFHQPDHPLHGRRLGCIIGIMTDPLTGQPTGAISRTYLDDDLHKVRTAKTWGRPLGIVRLSHDQDVLHGLHLAEGIETALAAAVIGARPIWSAGSDVLMAAFPVLSGIGCLTLFADNDESGAGLRAARKAEARWLSADREVHVKIWNRLGDFNDALREAGR
jgi:hypothetical protein